MLIKVKKIEDFRNAIVNHLRESGGRVPERSEAVAVHWTVKRTSCPRKEEKQMESLLLPIRGHYLQNCQDVKAFTRLKIYI